MRKRDRERVRDALRYNQERMLQFCFLIISRLMHEQLNHEKKKKKKKKEKREGIIRDTASGRERERERENDKKKILSLARPTHR